MTMQISLILPQIVALDVVFALAACLQMIHVPLIASRRSSYNRKVICAYETSLVLHLMISALILFASSGSYLVAPLDVCARAMGGVLWLNAAIFAYGVVLMVRYRRPVMLAELLLVGAVTPPVVFAMGSVWAVVLIAEGAFFLFGRLASCGEEQCSGPQYCFFHVAFFDFVRLENVLLLCVCTGVGYFSRGGATYQLTTRVPTAVLSRTLPIRRERSGVM